MCGTISSRFFRDGQTRHIATPSRSQHHQHHCVFHLALLFARYVCYRRSVGRSQPLISPPATQFCPVQPRCSACRIQHRACRSRAVRRRPYRCRGIACERRTSSFALLLCVRYSKRAKGGQPRSSIAFVHGRLPFRFVQKGHHFTSCAVGVGGSGIQWVGCTSTSRNSYCLPSKGPPQ